LLPAVPRVNLVCGFVTVTAAPTATAPVESFTNPLIYRPPAQKAALPGFQPNHNP